MCEAVVGYPKACAASGFGGSRQGVGTLLHGATARFDSAYLHWSLHGTKI